MAPAMNTNMLAHEAVQAQPADAGGAWCPLRRAGRGLPRLRLDRQGTARGARGHRRGGRRMLRGRGFGAARVAGWSSRAGPTYEDIDPVRYVGNRSSGRMGYALGRGCPHARGAQRDAGGGPDLARAARGRRRSLRVRSAEEMHAAVMRGGRACGRRHHGGCRRRLCAGAGRGREDRQDGRPADAHAAADTGHPRRPRTRDDAAGDAAGAGRLRRRDGRSAGEGPREARPQERRPHRRQRRVVSRAQDSTSPTNAVTIVGADERTGASASEQGAASPRPFSIASSRCCGSARPSTATRLTIDAPRRSGCKAHLEFFEELGVDGVRLSRESVMDASETAARLRRSLKSGTVDSLRVHCR